MATTTIKVGISASMSVDTDGSGARTLLDAGYGATINLGASDYDQVCSQDIVLAADGTTTIDLQAIENDLGVVVELAGVRAILVKNTGATTVAGDVPSTAQISVGGAATDAFLGFVGDATDTVLVDAGEPLLFSAKADKVVGSSDKDILITNLSSSAAITVKVVVIGTIA